MSLLSSSSVVRLVFFFLLSLRIPVRTMAASEQPEGRKRSLSHIPGVQTTSVMIQCSATRLLFLLAMGGRLNICFKHQCVAPSSTAADRFCGKLLGHALGRRVGMAKRAVGIPSINGAGRVERAEPTDRRRPLPSLPPIAPLVHERCLFQPSPLFCFFVSLLLSMLLVAVPCVRNTPLRVDELAVTACLHRQAGH